MILKRAKEKNSGLYQCLLRSDDTNSGNKYIDRKIQINVLEKKIQSLEHFDYYYEEGEEDQGEVTENERNSCNIVEAELSNYKNVSYICFDLTNTRQMSNFLVKYTGATAALYCHARGKS